MLIRLCFLKKRKWAKQYCQTLSIWIIPYSNCWQSKRSFASQFLTLFPMSTLVGSTHVLWTACEKPPRKAENSKALDWNKTSANRREKNNKLEFRHVRMPPQIFIQNLNKSIRHFCTTWKLNESSPKVVELSLRNQLDILCRRTSCIQPCINPQTKRHHTYRAASTFLHSSE